MNILMNEEIESEIITRGASLVKFVDISHLPTEQSRGFTSAILLGIVLSREFIQQVTTTPNYVREMVRNKQIENDEFHRIEIKTDRLADEIAEYLFSKGYSVFSQSEKKLEATGNYDEKNKISTLPHKTIALLGGLGWIGKHDLLVTKEFGSAISMCTILTNAPLETVAFEPESPQCGECNVCKTVCSPGAIKGQSWNINTQRDELVDVTKCTTCLECLVFCPWTQAYMNRKI